MGSHATQVAQAATPEIVSSAASSPTVVTTASSISERVVAAGMTILLAGGVTVGAATIVKHRDHDADRAAAPSPAAVAAPSPAAPVVVVPPVEREPRLDAVKAGKGSEPEPSPTGEVVVPPLDDPSTSPVPDPSASPTPDPTSPGPSPTGPPPAPDWSGSFLFLGPTTEPCDCEGPTTLAESRLEGEVGQDMAFRQVIDGVVHDSGGSPMWGYHLELDGTAHRSEGSLALKFALGTGDGARWYDGSGFLASVTRDDNGSLTYQFVGNYAMRSDQVSVPGAPLQGRVVALVSVWRDGTIYGGAFTLLEATA
jgi:hypothetical protein